MSTCGEVGSDVHALIKELAIRRVEHNSETHANESQHLAEGTEVARRRRRFSFVLQQTLSFGTCHHLCKQGVVLAGTRQLRSQGPVSVHAYCTDEVSRSEGRERANGIGGGNGVGGVDGDVNGDRDEDGAGTGKVEAIERTQVGNGDEDGAGTGTGMEIVDEHKMERGTEMRAVAETGTWTRLRTRLRTGSERAEERGRSARNRTRVVDAMREKGETRA